MPAAPRLRTLCGITLVAIALCTTGAKASGDPKPGRWRVTAELNGIDVVQRHTATLRPAICGDNLILDPDDHPALRLKPQGDGSWVGTSRAQNCTTHWRLSGSGDSITGHYQGSCPDGSMTASVRMQRTGPLRADPDPARAAPPDVPDDWELETDNQGDTPHDRAIRTVQRTLAAAAGGGMAAADSLTGYVWPDPINGTTTVGVWLTADGKPRLHQSLLTKPCENADGKPPATAHEPADMLLKFKLHRLPSGEYLVVAQLIDVKTGKIRRQQDAQGPGGIVGLTLATNKAFSKLGVEIPLP